MSDLETLIQAVNKGELERVSTILDANVQLVNQRDESGATPLHYATLNGQRPIVHLLVDRGAEINSTDNLFRATPTGWAIEYLREMNGFLGIELDDLAYAIHVGDIRWVERFLNRFPSLRHLKDLGGRPFQQLARESGNLEIIKLFD